MRTINALNSHKAIVLPVGVAVRGMLSSYCRACFWRMAGASLKLLATGISILHLAWILLLIFGAFWTRRRPFWTAAHLLSLVWGIIVEVGPWPCPLTLAEQYLQGGASLQDGYILHCVDSLVYPNLPYWVVAACGVVVCGVNLGVYAWRGWVWLQRRR